MIPFEPMLCSPQKEMYLDKFPDDSWIVETKFDGERIVAERKNGKVRLWTRRNIEATEKFPEVVSALVKTMPAMDWIVDGELTVRGGFEKLLTRNTTNATRVQILSKSTPGTLNIFDVLKVGELLMVKNSPLSERKDILNKMFSPNEYVKHVKYLGGSRAKQSFDSVVRDEGEGVVVKHRASLYLPGYRHPQWMKFKKCETVDVQIVGATGSDAGRPFGALVMVAGGKYFGKVGTGFTERQRAEIIRIVRSNPDNDDFARWGVPLDVKREMIRMCYPLDAEIKVLEMCESGSPRHPVWVRFKL